MGRHIVITVYFASDYYQSILKEHAPGDARLDHPSYAQNRAEMEELRSDAMEDISLYMHVWNDFEAYVTEDEHHSECSITLPKKADLDAGLLALVYHLFQRGQITGFTVMHTGA